MKSEEIYNAWIEKRRQVVIPESFTEEVIKKAHSYEQQKNKPLFNQDKLVLFLCRNSFAKAVLCFIGTILGLARVMLIIFSYLISIKGM